MIVKSTLIIALRSAKGNWTPLFYFTAYSA